MAASNLVVKNTARTTWGVKETHEAVKVELNAPLPASKHEI